MMLSGTVCIQSDDSNDMTMFLPSISDMKLVFRMNNHILYEYSLTKQELQDLQKGYGPYISYEFNTDKNLFEQKIDIYVEYKNSYIDKKIRSGGTIDCDWLTSESSTDILPTRTDEEDIIREIITE